MCRTPSVSIYYMSARGRHALGDRDAEKMEALFYSPQTHRVTGEAALSSVQGCVGKRRKSQGALNSLRDQRSFRMRRELSYQGFER